MNKTDNIAVIVKSALVGSGIGLYLAGYEQLGVVASLITLTLWLAIIENAENK